MKTKEVQKIAREKGWKQVPSGHDPWLMRFERDTKDPAIEINLQSLLNQTPKFFEILFSTHLPGTVETL